MNGTEYAVLPVQYNPCWHEITGLARHCLSGWLVAGHSPHSRAAEPCFKYRLGIDFQRYRCMSASKITSIETSPLFRKNSHNNDTIRDLNTYLPIRYTRPDKIADRVQARFAHIRGLVFLEVVRRAVRRLSKHHRPPVAGPAYRQCIPRGMLGVL